MTSTKSLARRHNGYQTWTFRQGHPTVLIQNFSDSQKRWGICAGLSTAWIKEHALGGSLVNKLGAVWDNVGQAAGLGRHYVPLVKHELRNVANLHVDASDYYLGQTVYLRDYLENHGIISCKRHDMSGLANIATAQSEQLNPIMGYQMAEALTDYSNCYIYFSCRGKKSGHAMAAWLGGFGEDACFFDPNFGEFWFENRDDFIRFFANFYQSTYLRGISRLNRKYTLTPYAKKV